MVAYQIVEEAVQSREVGRYTAFGVSAYRIEAAQKREITRISDVFLNNEAATRFVEKCNRLHLDIIHLPEVIEDVI